MKTLDKKTIAILSVILGLSYGLSLAAAGVSFPIGASCLP
jgi:hypothetical protein